ncbi:hypothetical protein [Flexibacterium corallicola]|uniref:hypothetical protein n=1 Tax=Flexibacterium corallicola TaxID=3037259 RepID=UPI00286F33DF|nr:hypothetical protein [Pseudovibrio sp. M1P-2-3]
MSIFKNLFSGKISENQDNFEFTSFSDIPVSELPEGIRMATYRAADFTLHKIEAKMIEDGLMTQEEYEGLLEVHPLEDNVSNAIYRSHMVRYAYYQAVEEGSFSELPAALEKIYFEATDKIWEIERYYFSEFGAGSVEYLTLANQYAGERGEIIAERDAIVEEYGYQSGQFVNFMIDLYDNTGGDFARFETPDGLEIVYLQGGTMLTLRTEDGSTVMSVNPETLELEVYDGSDIVITPVDGNPEIPFDPDSFVRDIDDETSVEIPTEAIIIVEDSPLTFDHFDDSASGFTRDNVGAVETTEINLDDALTVDELPFDLPELPDFPFGETSVADIPELEITISDVIA